MYMDSQMLHRVNRSEKDMMVTIAARWRIHTESNLWWIWFLSGRNGFFPLRTLCR